MKLKQRGRYQVINPDLKAEVKKKSEEQESAEYTDGFYTEESDEVPLEAAG